MTSGITWSPRSAPSSSHETITKITDEVREEVLAWQRRPLEALYPVIYLDALMVKVRDGAQVGNKSRTSRSASTSRASSTCWGSGFRPTRARSSGPRVLAELANRGVRDVLIVCCDGLTGFPEAIARDLAASDRSDVCRAPHPGCDALRQLQRPQSRRLLR